MTTKQTIQVGDEVTWTQTSQSGRTISMRQRTGIVQQIEDDTATVMPARRGKLVKITMDKLQRTDSGPTQLTRFVEALFAAHRQRPIARRQKENLMPPKIIGSSPNSVLMGTTQFS
jgi:hypothetical protein